MVDLLSQAVDADESGIGRRAADEGGSM